MYKTFIALKWNQKQQQQTHKQTQTRLVQTLRYKQMHPHQHK